MNAHTLRVLEFDRFLEMLAAYARTPGGQANLLALRPDFTADPARTDRP